jgi:rod shape-determining protein MreC
MSVSSLELHRRLIELLMLQRSHYVILGLVVVSTLIILNLPNTTTARLKLGIGSVFVPLFGVAGSAQQLSAQAGQALTSRGELLHQNEALRRENEELKLELQKADALAQENERLRKLLGWQREQKHKFKLARVVLRDPSNWWRTVQIDLGSRDGMKDNLPVLTTQGLAGRIASVSLTRSQVVLLGDANCKVAARVLNQARDAGVIGAAGPLEHDLVELGYLPRSAALKPGDMVETSGLGGIFPDHIPVGTVVDSQMAEFGLYTTARVKLAANLSSLDEVWVMVE